MKKEIDIADINQICADNQLEIKEIKSITGSFAKKIFIINNEFLLRVSETPMALEQEKFRRVEALRFVPKIKQVGVLEREAGPAYYTLLTLLPGADFVHLYFETTTAQQEQLGRDTSGFLDNLHTFSGTQYDIGHYIPAIPEFSGTWRVGHQKYWELLKQGIKTLQLKPDSIQVFARAFRFLNESIGALDFQTGPRLLHNDFHPRNIILNHGRFSGVIDWECSQYGEADFDLGHIIHWCLYPPISTINLRPFLRALFQSSPSCTQMPALAERLTIYQIEHELQQIIWQGGRAETERVPRLIKWMDGGVIELFSHIY